jgi:hypothetical protein
MLALLALVEILCPFFGLTTLLPQKSVSTTVVFFVT